MKIGITFSHPHFPKNPLQQQRIARYVNAVGDAGGEGVPIWRPRSNDPDKMSTRATKLAKQLDGLIVSGGKDLDPALYGQELNPAAKVQFIHPLRTQFETQLVRALRERGKPLLGICYGCQFFNVVSGGSLIQDVPTQWPNAIVHHESRHAVRLLNDSILHRLIGQEEFEVASYHHQAIAHPGEGARVTAHAPDGLVEAIEMDDDPLWIGVQWHPEWDRESLATQRLFGAFLNACRK
jgi:gamma-glutamyl-gamma-aminobutyrate hydrolase PuuD